MRHYAAALNDGIRTRVAQWSGTTFPFYPAIKQLTLDLAATSFLGIPWGPEAEKINKAFVDMVQASVGVVRVPLPFTAMGRGVAGRRRSEEHTSELQSLMRISYAVFCLKKKTKNSHTFKDK